jgi:hypothetical protein
MAVVLKTLLGSVSLDGSATDTYLFEASPLTQNVQQDTVRVACKTAAGVVGFTLPEIASYNGNYGNVNVIVFDDESNAGANNITVTCGGTDTIEGAATLVIATNDEAKTLTVSAEGKWNVE